METIHEDAILRVMRLGDGAAPNVFLCFTGIGHRFGGIQMEEFVGATQLPGFSTIFITDKARSWFNDFDATDLISRLAPFVQDRRVFSLGNSKGAFGAIWISSLLPVAATIAFSSQFSMHPEIMPSEHRWSKFRDRIETWRVPSLAESFSPNTRYYTFNGKVDEHQWERFPALPNCRHYLLKEGGHQTAAHLKEHDILTETIRQCVEGIDPIASIRAAGVKIDRILEADPA